MRLRTRLKMLFSFIRLTRDPSRLDEVFVLADKLASEDKKMMDEMIAHARGTEVGARAFAERPRVGVVQLERLRALPDKTLGNAFAAELDARGLDPSSLPQRPSTDDASFVMAHLYETHDIWHVVTGFDTDVAGELGLQAFYVSQVPGKLPIALLAVGLLNTLLFAFEDRHARLAAIARGYRLGRRARPFVGVQWATLWATPLDEVRRALDVEPEPAREAARDQATSTPSVPPLAA